jgi:hypothetical protein
MWRLNGKSKNDVSNGIQTADQLAKLGYKVFGISNGNIMTVTERRYNQ